MKDKLFVTELAVTIFILVAACFGFATTVNHRVIKSSGQLTMENYTDYMTVTCSVGSGVGGGGFGVIPMECTYYVTVKAAPHYKLENVKVAYTLECAEADLPSDYISTKWIPWGQSFSKESKATFLVTISSGNLSWASPKIKVNVTYVSGTFRYGTYESVPEGGYYE